MLGEIGQRLRLAEKVASGAVREQTAPLFSGSFIAYRDINIDVHQRLAIGRNASVLLTKSICTVIVDLLRMLYVLGSKEAKSANISRFDIFFGVADDHIRELNSQVGRLANGIAPNDIEAIMQIERDCSWVLRQIKYRNDVNFDIVMCFSVVDRVVAEAYELLERLIPEDLVRIQAEVTFAFRKITPSNQLGGIENMRTRLAVQSEILKHQSSDHKIRTIAHDSSQAYAVHYYLIDRKILSSLS